MLFRRVLCPDSVEPPPAPESVIAYVGLGGNLGDVVATFRRALTLLDPFHVDRISPLAPPGGEACPERSRRGPGEWGWGARGIRARESVQDESELSNAEINVLRVASLYRTRALTEAGYVDAAPPYWNTACALRTRLAPSLLMQRLLECEACCGRERGVRWASRIIDLDLLLYGEQMIDRPGLTVPHPHLRERPFVLWPLHELAPTLRIPVENLTVTELLARHPRAHEGLLGKPQAWPTPTREQQAGQ